MQSKTLGSEKLSSVYPLATSRPRFSYTLVHVQYARAKLFEKRSGRQGAEIPILSGIQGREKKK
jgi:hypothetical protein|tara:strand:+ start:380 stop:571 length:192 start_codon:yes stop_codon:yes gene_type:complete